MKKSLLESFKVDEFREMHFCVGGVRIGTGAPADPANGIACSLDECDMTATPIPSIPDATQPDYSNFTDVCPESSTSGSTTIQPALLVRR